MSAAAKFRGDDSRWNPAQLLVASLSACQALTYLHLASTSGVEGVRWCPTSTAERRHSG
jgi:organic hydroperoxide reductase OsmC/OhrA